MSLTNFALQEIKDTKLRDELSGKLANPTEFTQTDPRVWIAEFDYDGQHYSAGIRLGHRNDVQMLQYDVTLRVPDEHADSDTFIPESKVAEITRDVGKEFKSRVSYS